MSCDSPVTYIKSADSSAIGMFLSSLFEKQHRNTYCSEVFTIVKEAEVRMDAYPKVLNSYSRTIVARQQGGFEGMVARWDKGVAGHVHGHPDYAFYHLVHGRLGLEQCSPGAEGLELVASCIMKPGDHYCVEGLAGKFDNAIHRITALEESLSVHMYSDDALLGKCYHDYPTSSPFLEKRDEHFPMQSSI